MSDNMTPMEAYKEIYGIFDECVSLRKTYYAGTKGYSERETKAVVMAFEALRRMEEDEKK